MGHKRAYVKLTITIIITMPRIGQIELGHYSSIVAAVLIYSGHRIDLFHFAPIRYFQAVIGWRELTGAGQHGSGCQ